LPEPLELVLGAQRRGGQPHTQQKFPHVRLAYRIPRALVVAEKRVDLVVIVTRLPKQSLRLRVGQA
jgi:hypothetical protein